MKATKLNLADPGNYECTIVAPFQCPGENRWELHVLILLPSGWLSVARLYLGEPEEYSSCWR